MGFVGHDDDVVSLVLREIVFIEFPDGCEDNPTLFDGAKLILDKILSGLRHHRFGSQILSCAVKGFVKLVIQIDSVRQ
jgi:hypothetical protein